MAWFLINVGVWQLGNFDGAKFIIIAGLGVCGGTFSIISSVTWPRLFGVKHLGAISGFNMGWIVAGSALGPALYALGELITGNYNFISVAFLLISFLLLLLSLKIKQ